MSSNNNIMLMALRKIANTEAGVNSEPDVMGEALENIIGFAASTMRQIERAENDREAVYEAALLDAGYAVGLRHNAVKKGHPGLFMVYDPIDGDGGYCIIGNDRAALVKEALAHLEIEVVDGAQAQAAQQARIQQELVELDGQLTCVTIGTLDVDSGRDQYVHLVRKNREPLSMEVAEAWLLPRVYRESSEPGAYFCHNITLTRLVDGSESACLCVIHHRYDI